EKAIEHYKKAIDRRPSEYAHVNLGNIYFSQNRYFDALFQLQKGLEDFPESGPIMNNLGLLYSKTDIIDSALFYLEGSFHFRKSKTAGKNNLFAVLSESEVLVSADSLVDIYGSDDIVNKINVLAFRNSLHVKAPQKQDIGLEEMNRFTHAYINNFLVNQVWTADTSVQVLAREFLERSDNILFDRRIKMAMAINYYYNGFIDKAFMIMKNNRNSDNIWSGKTDNILGIWYVEQKDYKSAQVYFEEAVNNFHPDAPFNYAVALSGGGETAKALIQWDSLARKASPDKATIAKRMIDVITTDDMEKVLTFKDPQKYEWLYFHSGKYSEALFQSFESEDYKAKILLDKAEDSYKADHLEEAENYFSRLSALSLSQPSLKEEIAFFELKLLQNTGKTDILLKKLEQMTFPDEREVEALYFKALMADNSGDTLKAGNIFKENALRNPFYEDFPIAASNFYERKHDIEMAYNFLIKAITQNPNSLKLNKEYVRFCGRNGYSYFGQYTLEDMKSLLSDEDYKALEKEYFESLHHWETNIY
ncbi:MAG: tetratricopeptide repeat protein, partial [Cyclobacteriaceae bacterium]|nr:tetratricopeptide repeat protein [Cyclobacteriaceae bacterium]